MSNQGAAMSNGKPNNVNNNSALRRQLADQGVRAARAPLPCFGERLARLFDLSDTVALDAANVESRDGPFSADGKAAERLGAELEKLRHSQRDAIEASVTAERIGTRNGLPTPEAGPSPAQPPDFEPYRRFYQGKQRQMAAAVPPLRLKVRGALTDHSPALARLARIDAVLDATLTGYARKGFGAVPGVLEKRFLALWPDRQQSLLSDEPGHEPEDWMKQGAWLHGFCQEMKTMLLAELDARLAPVQGLLRALHNPQGPQ
jgi:hypothetical protein